MGTESCRTIRLSRSRLCEILAGIRGIRIGVVGDSALDAYWRADMTRSELSRETPHHPLPIVEERYSLGAGANVAANAKALGAGNVAILTVIGSDWRGRELTALLARNSIDDGYLIHSSRWITTAYIKPLRQGYDQAAYEDPRLDFANHTPLSTVDERSVISGLERLAADSDVIAVADQYTCGVVTPDLRAKLASVHALDRPVVADSRSRIIKFTGVIIKSNVLEAAGAMGREFNHAVSIDTCTEIARQLLHRSGKPVIITMGDKGALWVDAEGAFLEPACPVRPPFDTVGAGDAFLAAFCCAFAAGATGPEAVALANLAAGVTIGKIGVTGTASPEEILGVFDLNGAAPIPFPSPVTSEEGKRRAP